jgi:hypothetical protein
MQLSYDLSKLIISYSIIDELDIILFSKKWLSDEEYAKLKSKDNKSKEDIGKFVDNKFKENSKKFLSNMKDSMKNGKDVTAQKYIKRIQMIIPDFFYRFK